MREHLPMIAGIAAGALLLGALCGAGLGRADAGSAKRYGELAEDARAKELERRLAEVTADRDRLRKDNDDLSQQLRGASPALDLGGAVQSIDENAKKLLAAAEAARDEARAALERSQQELAKLQGQLQTAQRDAQRELQRAQRDAQQEIARLRQQLADSQGQIEGLRQEIATLNETIKALKLVGGTRR